MKHWLLRLAFVLIGAGAAHVAVRLLATVFANWYGPRYINSDADIDQVFMVLLGVLMVATVAGGVLGHFAYKRFRVRNTER
jgi:hypothetical protein